MKKIIILFAMFLVGSCLTNSGAYSCPIDPAGACKADIRGMNQGLNERILPNNLDKTIRPNNSIEMRGETTQPQTPSIINTESRPMQQNPQQGYDANCQFGNCMNKTPESEVSR